MNFRIDVFLHTVLSPIFANDSTDETLYVPIALADNQTLTTEDSNNKDVPKVREATDDELVNPIAGPSGLVPDVNGLFYADISGRM